MPSIDERVVSMAFENAVFEQRVAQTMGTLKKLDESLKNVGANQALGDIEKSADKVTLNKPMSAMDKLRAKFSKGTETNAIEDIEKAGNKVTLEQPNKAIDKTQSKLDQLGAGSTFSDIEKASNQVELGGVSRAISNVSNQFSVLQGAAAVALGNITSKATLAGGQFAKSFSFGPIQQGFEEYQTNLNSIQTILANTQGQQVSGLDEVNKHLQELNTYSDQTIYNFSEMAKNIGTFTAAGVDLDKSTQSIKGIANLAALSGSNSQQASTAMYQLSQAIAAGRVGLQDWNSVVNAGMGGAVFQKALMRTAENMGSIEKGALKIDKATGKATINGETFRNSIMAKPGEESWLTSDVLTSTLEQLTGDMTDAELASQGFTAAQIKAIQTQAATAKAAATEVKTLPQVFDVARESIGSGWSQTFQAIFGDFEESKKLFTEMSGFINDFISTNAAARNKVLADWKKMGGRTELIEGIKQAFANLIAIVKTIHGSFRDIFPAKTGKDLLELTKGFHALMVDLKPSPALLSNLHRIFAGLFAVLHIGWSIIKGVVGVVADLLGVVGKGSGGVLNFAGSIGDFLVAVDKALTKGGLLTGFFTTLTSVLKAPLEFIGNIASAFFDLFGSGDNAEAFGKGVTNGLAGVQTAIKPIDKVLEKSKAAWEGFLVILEKVGNFLDPWVDKLKDVFDTVADTIGNAFSSENFDKTLDVIKTVLMGGIFLQLKKLIKGGFGVDIGGGALSKLGDTFDALTGHLKAMQKNVQASILLKIAGALALLAASAFVFSTIEPKRLSSALGAMAIGLGQLVGAMALLTKTGGATGFVQVPAMAAGMVLLAGAMVILAVAAKIFASMDWEEIAKGLAGVGGGLTAIGIGMKFLGPSTLVQAVPLLGIAIALNLLAIAVKQFAGLSWEDLGKGLAGVGGSLVVIAGAMALFGPSTLLIGPGLIAVAFAMGMLAGAVGAMGALDGKTIAKGVLGIATALAAVAASLFLIPPTAALQGAGLILVAAALATLGGALSVIGNLSIGTLVKGIVGMAAALVVLSAGLFLMVGTLPGSLALIAAAGAFAILAPTMAVLGNLDWGTIFKALGVMALTMGVLAVIGTFAAAPLAVLGAALIVLGLGLVAITAPIYLFAKAISLLADTGQKGFMIFLTALTAFVALLPKIIIDFVKGLVGILDSIAEIAPKIVVALGKILDTVIQFVLAKSPDLFAAVGTFIGTFLGQFDIMAPRIIQSGIKLLLDFLHGVSSNITEVVNTAADIVVKFLEGLTRNAPRLSAAGLTTMLAFLSGISNGIPRIVGKVTEMIGRFLTAVTQAIPSLTLKGAQMIIAFINGISSKVQGIVSAGARLIGQFLVGIGNAIPGLVEKGLFVAKKFLYGMADGMVKFAHIGLEAILKFMRGLEHEIRTHSADLIDAGAGIGDAIFDGVAQAIDKAAGPIIDKLKFVFSKLPGPVKKVLGIKSPSKVFQDIGRFTMMGFTKGIEDNDPVIQKTAVKSGSLFIDSFKNLFGIRSPSTVMRDIGKMIGEGFKQGLEGSATDIRNSFKSLREKLNEEMRNARQGISDETKSLHDLEKQRAEKLKEIADLKGKKKPDQDAIKAANDDLKDIDKQINASLRSIGKYRYVLEQASDAHGALVGNLQASKQWLVALSKELDKVNVELDKRNQELDRLTQERADFAKSTQEAFNKLPEIDKTAKDPVADYKQKLKDQIEATKKFYATMMKLREQGLDDVTFKRLLSEGIGSQDFADQLSRSGERGIQELNDLDKQLADISGKLGTDAAGSLYDAGVEAAQGLVDGLKARKKELETVMGDIADSIVAAIKAALGIKSPSKVLMEVGKFAAQGMAQGFRDNAQGVADAAMAVGDGAVTAMQQSIAAMSDVVSDNLDVEPTITPVLDLTQVQKDAGKLSDLTNVTPITAATSLGQASAISAEQAATLAEVAATAQPIAKVELNQYNTSPESLSEIEIYRQTNNQMAQLQRVLGLP